MKRTIFIFGLTSVFLLFGNVLFNSCSKSEQIEVNNITQPTNEDYKSLLFELNVKFWTNLASHPISEIQNVCAEQDADKLIQLANFSNEELEDFMSKTIHYSEQILENQSIEDCNCGNSGNFENILSFVQTIQTNGGSSVFFSEVMNTENVFYKAPGYDPDRLYLCLAACFQTCLPLTWNPTAWAACYAACTALCYYLPD